MSRVRGKNTSLETAVCKALRLRGHRFSKHVKTLAGKPDIVFKTKRVVIFVDGDFWHGYRFSTWQAKLSPKWKKKITDNIARDRRNFRQLRKDGWTVVRVWGHSVKKDLDQVVLKIERTISKSQKTLR